MVGGESRAIDMIALAPVRGKPIDRILDITLSGTMCIVFTVPHTLRTEAGLGARRSFLALENSPSWVPRLSLLYKQFRPNVGEDELMSPKRDAPGQVQRTRRAIGY